MKRLFGFMLIALFVQSSWSQEIKEMEFKNQEITDILLALGSMAGRSIVPDETVTGKASYYFTNTEFETALQIFLSTYKLYYWKDNNVYYVSRIKTSYDRQKNVVSLDAVDVDVQLLIRAMSKAMQKTVLFDSLPRTALTIHTDGVAPEAAFSMMMRQFTDYAVETTKDYYYIKNIAKVDLKGGSPAAGKGNLIEKKGELYTLNTDKARFLEILNELFTKAGKEYSLLLRNDSILENIHFKDKSFEDILHLVLEQVGADYQTRSGIYYVFEIQKRDVLKKYKTTVSLPLAYLSVQELPNLLPQDLASQNLYRLDKQTNTIILTGSKEEIGPIQAYVQSIDKPQEGRSYYRFDIKNMKVKDVLGILPSRFTVQAPVTVPDSNSFVIQLTKDGKEALEEYLALIDKKNEGFPVRLKFTKAETLLKTLPPSVAKEEVVDSGNPSVVFFVGSEEKRRRFLRELEVLDQPVPQIRYELLVVQYQKSKSLTWNSTQGYGKPDSEGSTAFSGSFDSLLSVSFDIVSNFGYQFASKLSLDLGITTAQVMADTTLNGISGQQIKFQNTNTYRYRDFEVDPDTGEWKSTGVTRELTSGLIIALSGWTSGDGMITMTVSATVSKRGTDTSSTTGNPPQTSEKVVSTSVRTPSGKPVIIGGLLQQDKDKSVKKVPVLGDIPLLGYLFRSEVESVENTEMIIYIVPHLEYPDLGAVDLDRRFDHVYNRFVRKK